MTDWEVLGIEPTDDKEAIKAAYYQMLPQHHPEEDPEGFARLRQAFETLMKEEPKERGEDEVDDTPTGIWAQKVRANYEDFAKRIVPSSWEELLKDDVCFGLDTADEANEKLLVYLMDHYYLPHECLQVLEAHFNWEEKKKELYNKFPGDFIDYVLANAKYEDNFRYPLFGNPEPGKDYDAFMAGYFRTQNQIEAGKIEEAGQTLEDIKKLGIRHPDFLILQVRYALIVEDYDNAKPLVDELLEWRPDDTASWYSASRYYMAIDDVETAMVYYKKLLEANAEHVGALVGMGDSCRLLDLMEARREAREALAAEGNPPAEDEEVEPQRGPGRESLENALTYYKRAYDILPYDNYINNCIYSVNMNLSDYYKQDCEDYPEDDARRIKAARTFEETYQFEEAGELAEQVSAAGQDTFEYANLMGDICRGRDEHQESFDWYQKALAKAEGQEDQAKVYADMGLQLLDMERYEEALDIYEKGLTVKPDYTKLMYRKAAALNKLGRFGEALEICDQELEIDPLPNTWHYKAEALYGMGEYGRALDACEQAISIVPYIDTFLIEIKIYYGADQFEQVLNIIQRMEERELMNSEVMLFKLRALRMMDRYDEARDAALEIMEHDPDNAEVYYQLAFVEWDQGQLDQALIQANKSLEMDPSLTYKRYFIADVYKRMDQDEKALEIYLDMLEKDPQDDFACSKAAEVHSHHEEYEKAEEYYRRALEINPDIEDGHSDLAYTYESMGQYQKALTEINLQLEKVQADRYYVQKGVIYLDLDREEDALKAFNDALVVNPQSSVAFNMIGYVHKNNTRFREAIPFFEKGIEGDDPYPALYFNLGNCLQRTGRYQEAIDCLTAAIEKFPNEANFYSDRADVYKDIHEYEKMMEDSEAYEKITGDHMYLMLQNGDACRYLERYQDSISWYEKGLALDKKDARPYKGIARVYLYGLKNYKKAISYLEKAAKCSAKDPAIPSMIAEAFRELGKERKARKYGEEALSLYQAELKEEPESAQLLECIGDVYLEMGEIEKAKEYLTKALDRAPWCRQCSSDRCHEALYDLGKLYEKLGDMEKALDYYKQALDAYPEERYQEAVERLEKE